MTLKIQMLARGFSLNYFRPVNQVNIFAGETVSLGFQLVDSDTGVRYCPPAGSTVQVLLARYTEVIPDISGMASEVDYSISRAGTQAFPLDGSIWYIPLLATETPQLISSSMLVTVTDPANNVLIASAPQAISVNNGGQSGWPA